MAYDYLAVASLTTMSSVAILLIATLGLAVIFGLMGVINLAHGEFITFGAYAALLASGWGLPFPLAVGFATVSMALYGVLVERLIIRHLYNRIFDTLLATWGLSLVMYQAVVLTFGSVTPGIGMSPANLSVGDYSVSWYILFLILVAVFLILLTGLILTRTNYGMMARAAIQDSTMASAVGIESGRINTMTFALGSGLAGFAGAILLPAFPATPSMGFAFSIKAFLLVVVGGPVTLTGIVSSGGALGTIASVVANTWTTVLGDIVFLMATMLLLRIFPKGISENWRIKL